MSEFVEKNPFNIALARGGTPQEAAASQVATLTSRQRQIMDMVLSGQPSKNIAADLGISQRTVEKHRADIMRRTGSRSLPALARLALLATWDFEVILRSGNASAGQVAANV